MKEEANPNPIKEALEEIVRVRLQPASDLTTHQMRSALITFSAKIEAEESDIPGDILEVLGPEDRRAALLVFCNLVAVGYGFATAAKQQRPSKPTIIIPGRKL